MDDADTVEVAHSSHNTEQHLVRPAVPLEFMMRAWVVNPNKVPEICTATLQRYVEASFRIEVGGPYAERPDDVRVAIGLEHVKTRRLLACLVSVLPLPLNNHSLVCE